MIRRELQFAFAWGHIRAIRPPACRPERQRRSLEEFSEGILGHPLHALVAPLKTELPFGLRKIRAVYSVLCGFPRLDTSPRASPAIDARCLWCSR